MAHESKYRAIEIAQGQHPLPTLDAVDTTDRPLRYGLLNRPIVWAIERLDDSPEAQQAIVGTARSLRDIKYLVRRQLEQPLEQAHHDDELRPTMELLDHIQDQRALRGESVMNRTALDVLSAGAGTYVDVSEAIYSGIEKHHSDAIASHPLHASILNKMTQLGLNQLSAFIFHCLSDEEQFAAVLEQRGDGAMKLVSDWKERTLVSLRFQEEWHMLSQDDLEKADTPLSAIDEDTIGCPVTFAYRDVSKLWNFYAQTRQTFTQQQKLAGKSLELTREERLAKLLDEIARARTPD